MTARPDAHPQEDVSATLDDLFEEWKEQETHVDLSDLRPEDSIVFVVFWALFAVVFMQFFTRYVLNDSWGWTEEIARYLLIGVTFIGAVTAMRKGSHIAVEAMLKVFPSNGRHWVFVGIDAVVAGFSILMTWTAAQLASKTNQYMVSIEISKAIVYWGCAAAFAAMTLHALLRLWRRIRRREADELHTLTID